jgi:hypothetical protein
LGWGVGPRGLSTLRQSDDGESLEVQQRTIAGYAQMHGLTVEKVFGAPPSMRSMCWAGSRTAASRCI